MKPKFTFRRFFPLSIVLAGAFTASSAIAATWDLTKTGTQSWKVDANWTTPATYPNAEGAIADLRVNIGNTLNINLDQAITVGTLYIGDTNQTHATTIAAGTDGTNPGKLIMDVASGTALISKTYSGTTDRIDTISADIQLNDNVVVNNTAGHNNRRLVLSGIISGEGRSLEVTGGVTAQNNATSVVVMSKANTYNGTTTITSGTLQLGVGTTGNNGSVAGNIVNNSILLFNNFDDQTLSGTTYSGTGTLIKGGAGKLTLSGTTTVANLITGDSKAAGTGAIEVASGGSLSVGSGSANTLKVGSDNVTGTLNASAANSFAANVGILAVGSSSTSGAAATGTLTLSNTGNTIKASTAVYIGWESNPVTASPSGNSGTVTSAANTSITTPLMGLGANKVVTGTYTQTAGTLTLAGMTAETGAQLILGYQTDGGTSRTAIGTMDLSAANAIANLKLSKLVMADIVGGGNTTHAKGSLLLSNNAANHLEIKGSSNVVTLGLSRSTGGTDVGSIATLTIGNLDATSFIESTTSNATAMLIASKTGAGNVKGVFNFNGGTLKITTVDGGAAIAGGGGTSELNLSGGAKLVAGANSNDWIHSLTTATLGTDGAIIDTAGFNIGISQAFSGTGKLTKDGAGTLALDGTSTYNGDTLVSAGTLLVNGALGNTAVTVDPTGTIGGDGTIGGSLTFNDISVDSEATGANLDLTGATISTLGSTGILTVSSSITLNNFAFADIIGWNAALAEAGTYTLINGGGTVTLSGSTPTVSNPFDFGGGKKGYFQAGSLQAVIVIPEPRAALLGGLGLLMLLRRRRA